MIDREHYCAQRYPQYLYGTLKEIDIAFADLAFDIGCRQEARQVSTGKSELMNKIRKGQRIGPGASEERPEV